MQTPALIDGQFINGALLNGAVAQFLVDFGLVGTALHTPGLLAPAALTFVISGLNVTVEAPAPFAVLFGAGVSGTGLIVQANGQVNGQLTSNTTVAFAPLVPGSGSVTAYIIASYMQVGQQQTQVIGPPIGHPDYNPNFAPFQFFLEELDSLNIIATTTAANNTTTFELGRTTLTAGQVTISSITTANWLYASSVLAPTGVAAGTYTGATVTVGADGRVTAASSVGYGVLAGSNSWTAANAFSASPTAPTPAAGNSTTNMATTAFTTNAVQQQAGNYATDTGSVNALQVTLAPVPGSLSALVGSPIRVSVANTNTGAATLAVNGLTATAIADQGGNALQANALILHEVAEFIYNGTNFMYRPTYGRLINIQTISATQTYTPTPGTTSVVAELVGAGGAGGGCQATGSGQISAGPGGGGGGYARHRMTSGFAGTLVSIGAGGTGVTGAAGGNGQNTTFGAIFSATGGVGGTLGGAVANTLSAPAGVGVPGAGVNGDVNALGGIGWYAFYAGVLTTSGAGGESYFGAGASWVNGSTTGGNAFSPGSGGGGGCQFSQNSAAEAGGSGANGLCIVWEYA